MGQIQQDANVGPGSHKGIVHGGVLVQPEDADGCVEKSIHDARAGTKVIELLGETEVTGMEYHAEGPACQAKVAKQKIIFAKAVG